MLAALDDGTRLMFRDARNMVRSIQHLAQPPHGETLQIGIYRDNNFDADRFTTWRSNIKDKCIFELAASSLRKTCVGDEPVSTVDNRLRDCKQEETFPDGSSTMHPAAQQGERFRLLLGEMDPTAPINVNLSELLFSSFVQPLKEQLTIDGYKVPQQAATNDANVAEMDKLIQEAVKAEKQMKQIIQLTGQNQTAFSGVNAFHASVDFEEDGMFCNDCDPAAEQIALDAEETCIYAFISNAEEALQKASGTKFPRQCLGCQGTKCNPYHSWRECPNKHKDKEAADNGARRIKEWWEQKEKATFQRADVLHPKLLTDWLNLGFPSKEVAESCKLISAASTSAVRRQQEFASLAKELSKHRLTSTTAAMADPANVATAAANAFLSRLQQAASANQQAQQHSQLKATTHRLLFSVLLLSCL